MNDEQRREFCQMFFRLHLMPFTDREPVTAKRLAALQRVIDDMEDRAFAHYTTGEFIQRGAALRPMSPRPRQFTAEWLEWRKYDGFDPGHLWNGWACPLITKAQLERLLPDHNTSAGIELEDLQMELRSDDVLTYHYLDGEEVKHNLIHPARGEGIGELLYDIGSLGLCWEWAEDAADRCSCGSSEFRTIELLTSTTCVCVWCGKEKS